MVSAGRDGLTLPITPVLRSERAAILSLIASLSSSNNDSSRTSVNQHTACNFETAAATWNKRCMDELQKPFEQRQKIFPKTASQLRSFYAKHLQECNARATARQTVEIDLDHGLIETILLS